MSNTITAERLEVLSKTVSDEIAHALRCHAKALRECDGINLYLKVTKAAGVYIPVSIRGKVMSRKQYERVANILTGNYT